MGGICGQVTFDGTAVEPTDVDAMTAAAGYRGSDGSGTWHGKGAVLAHQRTLVLPEDAFDRQPLTISGLVLVADARVDNRDALVPTLCRRGYLADTATVTDAEIILAAYRLWGVSCPARLIGDFAFVLWDERLRRIFAARDPMGMRALYQRWEPHRRLLFATEIKQILAAERVPRRIYEPAIAATLAGPQMPPSWTAYAGIEQLPPGHALLADERERRSWRFWTPRPEVDSGYHDEGASAAAFRESLGEAVKVRLRSQRPVGIFLSGGMDSGSVASMAGWLRERGAVAPAPEIHTYSWAFRELPDSDERAISDHIVARYRLRSFPIFADHSWPLAGYPQHGPDADDPYCGVYQALTERALDRCRDEGVGIVIRGDRGDELTGDWAYDELGLLRSGRVRAFLADVQAVASSAGVSPWSALYRHVLRPTISARWPGLGSRLTRHDGKSRPWPPWVPDDFAVSVDLGDVIAEGRRTPRFDGAGRSVRYQRVFLPHAARIAVLRERTHARYGMAFSDPYSDRRLVELILSLPQWCVQRRISPKGLARAAMADIMPEEARQGARKTIPYGLFDRGFRDRARGVVEDLLTRSHAAQHGWLNEKAARSVYSNYLATGDTRWDFWWPLTVEMWLRRWWNEGASA